MSYFLNRKKIVNRYTFHPIPVLIFVFLVMPGVVLANQDTPQFQENVSSPAIALKLTPQTPESALKRLKNTDIVELPGGKRVRMGKIRKFSVIAKKLRTVRKIPKPLPRSLQFKPAATGIRVNSLAELKTVLEKPDDETIQLPSGRVATVAQVKFLQPLLEKRLGKKLSQFGGRLTSQGEVVKLKASTDKKYWRQILTKPDNTILESPQGKRFTVGDLKKFIASGPLSSLQSRSGHKQGGRQ
jgi:hypothetical protein